MIKMIHQIHQMLESGLNVATAVIMSKAGSVPRTPGTRMLINPDGSAMGTIGGGLLEAQALETAKDLLQSGTAASIKKFVLQADTLSGMDMLCGGNVEILFEKIDPAPSNIEFYEKLRQMIETGRNCQILTFIHQDQTGLVNIEKCLVSDGEIAAGSCFPGDTVLKEIQDHMARKKSAELLHINGRKILAEPVISPACAYIFGAGHISGHLAVLTQMTHFKTVVIDDRSEFANRDRFPGCDEVVVIDDFAHAIDGLEIDQNSYIVIVTRGHHHDKTVLQQALKTGAGYIGMVGSLKKRDAIYAALEKEGFARRDLEQVHCPIGLAIKGRTPEEIAVSIVAEMIAVRSG